MPGTPTPKYGIPTVAEEDFINAYPAVFNDAMGDLDALMATVLAYPAARPAAGKAGRYYIDVQQTVYVDTGLAWQVAGGRLPYGVFQRLSTQAAAAGWSSMGWEPTEGEDLWEMRTGGGTDDTITVPADGIYAAVVRFLFGAPVNANDWFAGSLLADGVTRGRAETHSHVAIGRPVPLTVVMEPTRMAAGEEILALFAASVNVGVTGDITVRALGS